MSNEENQSQTIVTDSPVGQSNANVVNNLLAKALELKDKNPKVFFAAVGSVVVLLIIVMSLGSGSSERVSGPVMKNLVVGQRYVLQGANTQSSDATVRLVSSPGVLAAYDDTEEADRNGACQHMPNGTPVSVLELQEAYGKKNAYAKVQIEGGECKGNIGWALSIDVQ